MAGFDFVTACENIVAAWDYVIAQLIEKCFHMAGFIYSVPTASEPEKNVRDNIQQILNVQVPFNEYATADDQVEMIERLSEAEIVWRVQGHHHPEEGEEQEDGEDPDSDDGMSTTGSVAGSTTAADESEIIHTANQFLCTTAQQKAYVLRNKLPSGAIDALNNVEQFILNSKLMSCRKQTDIWSFSTVNLIVDLSV